MDLVKPPHRLQPPHMHALAGPSAPSHGIALATMGENRFAPHRAIERYSELDITFFVACFNEEGNIVDTLENLRGTLLPMGLTYEIIVIDDGSKDRSAALVGDYQKTNPDMPVLLVRNPQNRGLSRNFVEAAFLGRGRYFKLICGDNVDDRDSLTATLLKMGHSDVVVPYHREIQGRTWTRRFLSRSYTNVVNLLSGFSLHYYNGCPVFHRADVMRWHSRRSGFGFQAEVLISVLREGGTYLEVPIIGKERPAGASTALKLKNWMSVFVTLSAILIQRIRKH